MKKSLATLLVLAALCVPAFAGVMGTDPAPEPPPPAPSPLDPTTSAAYVVPVIVVAAQP